MLGRVKLATVKMKRFALCDTIEELVERELDRGSLTRS